MNSNVSLLHLPFREHFTRSKFFMCIKTDLGDLKPSLNMILNLRMMESMFCQKHNFMAPFFIEKFLNRKVLQDERLPCFVF